MVPTGIFLRNPDISSVRIRTGTWPYSSTVHGRFLAVLGAVTSPFK